MTKKKTPPVTAEMAGKIKHLLSLGWLQHHIAGAFDINQGRVSEVKNGTRHPEVGPIPV